MMSQDEFVRKWKHHTAGIIALGSSKLNRVVTAPFANAAAFGQVVCDLDETAESLLIQLYKSLTQAPPPPRPAQPEPAVTGGKK